MEHAVVFGSDGLRVGVLTSGEGGDAPSVDRGRCGVVLLNAGIVHRSGPHRLYVTLARRLARRGVDVLRFDHSGIGDSPRRKDELPFRESAVSEARDAMDFLEREHGCSEFVLLGLCSGTLSAFDTATADPRVRGLVLLTALLEDPSSVDQSLIQQALDRRTARSYVSEKALDKRAWSRLLTGKVSPTKIARIVGQTLFRKAKSASAAAPPPGALEVRARLETLLERGVRVLFVYGDPTTVLEYFRMTVEPALPELTRKGSLDVHVLERSDHTFTSLRDQEAVLSIIDKWLSSSPAATTAEAACT